MMEPCEDASKFRLALDAPWAALNEVRRILAQPFYRLLFAILGVPWGKGWRIHGMPIIQRYRGSQILLGDGLALRSWRTSNPLCPSHPVVLATRARGAVIRLGRDVAITGATLVAAERIDLGDRVSLGANVVVVDTDFHPLDPVARAEQREGGRHAPVVIEDDAFIGMNTIVLKGVRIGARSVVGAGSVVTSDIPPDVIAAGNPARVIRSLHPSPGGSPDAARS